jgi:phenylacetate-coenzyme A ligase PaaK-like adenylate-forming protein
MISKPECLSGYSSGVYLLALEQLKGNLKIHPTRILSSADPLTSEMRETIRNAFGIMPYNYYAASDLLMHGIQCDRLTAFIYSMICIF